MRTHRHDPPGAQHSHGAHGATLRGAGQRRALWTALALLVAFMGFELAAAVVARSVALLADAGHMLVDAGALAGSLWAMSLVARPPNARFTYGLVRAEILAAAVNGVTLLVTAALVAFESVTRLVRPSNVHGPTVVVVACAGAAVNLGATLALRSADRSSLNIEGAFQHVVTDLYAFMATAAAGAVIWATGYHRADPIASLVVVVLMLRAAWSLIRGSGRVLLEGTPESVDLEDVRRHVEELPEVVSVHELHAWTLGSNLPVLSAHVVVPDDCLGDGTSGEVLDRLQDCLAEHFDVGHSTFQLEPASHARHERAPCD
jgi:cobalt-zinc-cadmium efflux system protein